MRAERPSLTARVIARGVAFVAEDSRLRGILPPGAVELNSKLLLEAGVLKPWMVRLYRQAWYRRFFGWVVRNTATGQIMTLPVRKRFMDDEARRAIDGGARQLLVVGAGFDTLALRMAERFPHVQCFEIDRAATQRMKRAALESMRIDRPNLYFLPLDLADASLPHALARTPVWRRDAVSVVTAEGLLCYLEESEVIKLLDGVRSSTAPGSTLLLTHMRTDERGAIVFGRHARFMQAALELVGEPVKWAIAPDALGGFLAAHGFILDRAPTPDELRERYLEPVGLGHEIVAHVELMAVAKVP
jgi:methyltransferase (TIGR00027 family)